jgi:hypothetical protein
MHRRALLATAGSALLAGCTLPTSAPTKFDAPSPGACRGTTTPDYYSTFCVGDRTAAVYPHVDAGDASVTVGFESPATADSPAVVSVRVTNDTAEPAPLLHPSWWLEPPPATHDDTALHLLPTPKHPLADADIGPEIERTRRGYWRATNRPARDATDGEPISAAVEAIDDAGRLTPGGSVTAPFSLVLGPNTERFRPGRYRFGQPTVLSLSAWSTSSPGPEDPSRFESPAVPPAAADARWYHRADEGTATYLEPSAERVTGNEVRFRLVNRSPHSLSGNPYNWRLYRLTNGGWREHHRDTIPQPLAGVAPGDHHTWTFDVTADPTAEPPPLGPGSYAFVADFSLDDHLYAVRFDVVAS